MSIRELQLAVQRGDYVAARREFVRLMRDPTAPTGLVFAEMSVAEYRAGNLHTSLAFAEAGEAITLTQSEPDFGLLGRLRLNLMAFYMEAGDVAKAISLGMRSLAELDSDPGGHRRRGRIYYNLGLAFRQRNGTHDSAEALRYYELARIDQRQLRETAPGAEERERARVYEVATLQNAAWLLCEQNSLERAQTLAREAAVLLAPSDESARREQVLLAAYLALRHGETEQCLALLSDFSMHGGDSAPARQQFWSAWLAAHAYWRLENDHLAEIYAVLAGDQAAHTQIVYLMRLAQDVLKMVKPRSQAQ